MSFAAFAGLAASIKEKNSWFNYKQRARLQNDEEKADESGHADTSLRGKNNAAFVGTGVDDAHIIQIVTGDESKTTSARAHPHANPHPHPHTPQPHPQNKTPRRLYHQRMGRMSVTAFTASFKDTLNLTPNHKPITTRSYLAADNDEDFERNIDILTPPDMHVPSRLDITPRMGAQLQSSPPVPSYLYRTSVTKDTFLKKNTEYATHFIDFDALHAILDDVGRHKPNSTSEFLQRLDAEWNAYRQFVETEAANINQLPVQKYIMLDVLKFNQFVCINQRSLQEVIREYDALSLSGNLCAIWDWKMSWKPQKLVFPLIKKISDLYRQEQNENTPGSPNAVPEQNKGIDEFSFDRKSVKYFVKRSNLVQVISVVIQHLPIFVFGEDNNENKNPSQQKQKKESAPKSDVSGHVTSVYFDSSDFKSYHGRVAKEEGARVFRIRWYGDKDPIDAKCTVFMERKIHHQSWLNTGPSMKERFTLKSGKVRGFLNGSLHIPEDQASKRNKLQREIQELVSAFGMTPKTRTVCDRISFQLPHNNDLRISLDLNLQFVKERSDLFAANDAWWFTPPDQLRADDVVDFAFDVLEIKLAGAYTDNPPKWVQDLMDSALLCECYKFSKYGQSVQEFYANRVVIVPKWIQNINVLRMARERKIAALAAVAAAVGGGGGDHDHEFGRVCAVNKDVRIAIQHKSSSALGVMSDDFEFSSEHRKPKKSTDWCLSHKKSNTDGGKKHFKPVNPKVHFSAERTFLQWFKAAIFIGSSGLSVNALAPKEAAGLMMVSVAGIIVIWAMVVYYIRSWKLLQGQMEGLHDLLGPGFLGCLLLGLFAYAAYDEKVRAGFL